MSKTEVLLGGSREERTGDAPLPYAPRTDGYRAQDAEMRSPAGSAGDRPEQAARDDDHPVLGV